MTIHQTASMCHWQRHFWHMNMGCCQKYHIIIPTYNHKFVWPYFKQIVLIFPALIFAYTLPSPWKVCHTNSYVKLKICMTILQTASLCRWQHQFLAYEHGYLQKYQIPIPTYTWKFVWVSFKQLLCVAGSINFGIRTWLPSKVFNANSYVKSLICTTIF